ncbi:MAG: cyclic nucleotide-binding domain-containing protein [Actinobacteria bacterium]|nr:cyclic nucleotide-binding domain-containing protein [Actinomycetota bacterium]
MEGRPVHSLVKALQAVPSLAGLDERALLAIVGDSANLFWPAGSCVFERGSQTDSLYVVVSGSVRILDEGGVEAAVLEAGNSFGEFSLLLGTPHQHEVRALEDTELMVVPKQRFDQLVDSNRELGRKLRDQAEERMRANLALAAERA